MIDFVILLYKLHFFKTSKEEITFQTRFPYRGFPLIYANIASFRLSSSHLRSDNGATYFFVAHRYRLQVLTYKGKECSKTISYTSVVCTARPQEAVSTFPVLSVITK